MFILKLFYFKNIHINSYFLVVSFLFVVFFLFAFLFSFFKKLKLILFFFFIFYFTLLFRNYFEISSYLKMFRFQILFKFDFFRILIFEFWSDFLNLFKLEFCADSKFVWIQNYSISTLSRFEIRSTLNFSSDFEKMSDFIFFVQVWNLFKFEFYSYFEKKIKFEICSH